MIKIEPGKYLALNIDQVVNDMKQRVLEFMYIRWDGKEATQKCTLSPAYIKGPIFSREDGDNRAQFLNDALNEGWREANPPSPKAVIHCWDVENQRWTSIPTWSVMSLNAMNWG